MATIPLTMRITERKLNGLHLTYRRGTRIAKRNKHWKQWNRRKRCCLSRETDSKYGSG